MTTFDKCIEVVLKHEGGFQRHPSDRGNYRNGELIGTKYGIAARFFPNEDIPRLTIERAREIYYQHYWKPMKLEGISDELVMLHIFDHGVNAGRKRAILIAQELAGVKRDGDMGPITKAAINSQWNFLKDYIDARIDYYHKVAKNGNNQVFLRGWLIRVTKTFFP